MQECEEGCMEVSIRQATAEDYNVVCDLFDEVDALHCDSLPDIFRRSTGPARELDYYLGLIADEDVGLFVAEVGGRIVGFAHAVIREAPAIPIFVPRRYAVVEGIGVTAEFRGRGIGRGLMDTVEAWARARGARSVELNVYEFNNGAIAFYESLGYGTRSRKMSKALGSG